jgi:hypothetical protein
VKDLCGLLELFEKRKVALVSVAESLDTGSAAGRLVITIMEAVSQWEREAIGERTRDAHSTTPENGPNFCGAQGECLAAIEQRPCPTKGLRLRRQLSRLVPSPTVYFGKEEASVYRPNCVTLRFKEFPAIVGIPRSQSPVTSVSARRSSSFTAGTSVGKLLLP